MRTTSRPSRSAGSVLVQVLLVLAIMSGLGITLLFITDVEEQLGVSEQVFTETAFGAEAGLHAALASMLITQNWSGEEFVIEESPEGSVLLDPNRKLGVHVRTTRIFAVGAPQLPPLTIANEGDSDYFSYSLMMRSEARQVSWPKVSDVPMEAPANEVFVSSETSMNVRYMLSPLRAPASPSEPFNPNNSSPLKF